MINTGRRAAFYTLGCRVNQYETRAIEEQFIKAGFEICSFSDKCDVYIINTCTVTAESDRKSRQMIRRAKQLGGQNAVVMATGCMVQVWAEGEKTIPELDFAVGTREKMTLLPKALELLDGRKTEVQIRATDFEKCGSMEKMNITGSDTTRAFLKISDGCNNCCSYCIIPKARGPVCSKSEQDVCAEVVELCGNGWREVVLTGIETAAYGKELENADLATLIDRVNSLDCELKRIRLGSLEPTFIKEENVKKLALYEKLMPHYHLSLQSGSDAVLAAMRRKYNTKQFFRVTELLRENIKNVTLTTDIIVGFPGETDEMFEETCDFVRKCRFLFVHIFPYSDRTGTDASKMKNKIPEAVKKHRAAKLKDIMLETRRSVLAEYEGVLRYVLVETVENGIAAGHTDNFMEVHFDIENNTDIDKNSIVCVRIGKPDERLEYVNAEIVTERRN